MTKHMRGAVINIGHSISGQADGGAIDGDAIVWEDGKIVWIGASADVDRSALASCVDADGATVIPGLIDSHVHSTFGDYTPRQNTIGFLESYVHGGTTSVISASEVHVPGRPRDVEGVKALAVAAQRSYEHYRPGGMRVHAGSVVLEPGLTEEDFAEVRAQGVWLAKAGFGAFASAKDYIPVVHAAQRAGLTVMCHTGGGSIPGSLGKIDADALLEMRPNIAGHCNGGPTALSTEENERLVAEGEGIALQLVHAGNLRSAIDVVERALAHNVFERLMIATDTPTGTGVIPLGMLRTMAELASLSPLTPTQTVLAATANVQDVYGLDEGRIRVGGPADIVVLDAPAGSTTDTALDALAFGDLPAVASVITVGEIRVTKSRNTPPPKREVRALEARA